MTSPSQTRRKQTDRAISDARARINRYSAELQAISKDPSQERLTEITVQTVREVLFAALQHAPLTDTSHAQADDSLRQAATIAALQAREAVHPTVECNINAARPRRLIAENQEEWMYRMSHTLSEAGQGIRDVYKAVLMACTGSIRRNFDTKEAGEQALSLASHVSAVIDTATNVDAVRERLPAVPEYKSPFQTAKDALKDQTGKP